MEGCPRGAGRRRRGPRWTSQLRSAKAGRARYRDDEVAHLLWDGGDGCSVHRGDGPGEIEDGDAGGQRRGVEFPRFAGRGGCGDRDHLLDGAIRRWRSREPGDNLLGPIEAPVLLDAALDRLSKDRIFLKDLCDEGALPYGEIQELLARTRDIRPRLEI